MTLSFDDDFQQPVLQYNARTKLFRLVEEYEFEWGPEDARKRLICPAGFEYDKASVPKMLRWLARPDGPWEAAALFHDRLYLFKGKLPLGEFQVCIDGKWHNDSSPWTRKQADKLLQMMGVLGGASTLQARRYYWAVRIWPENWFKF